jgi:hypothetical protein
VRMSLIGKQREKRTRDQYKEKQSTQFHEKDSKPSRRLLTCRASVNGAGNERVLILVLG